jgi:hypothetical protein
LAQINDALIGNVNYQGLWNAATNNPTLVNPPSSGTKGYYYIVSTAGTFAGISFEVGDWIISNGSAWQKVDNTDAVSSVFGRTGNVIAANGDYNTSLVTENTNLYYTEARVSANTDVAANTAARHNAVTLGTANGLSLSTQQLSLGLASAGVTGALSGTDWSTFNSKQQALNGTGFVKISGTTISYDNSTYLTTAAAASTYLPLAGGTMTGNINWAQTDRGIVWSFNTDAAYIKFFNTGDGDTDSRLEFATQDNNDEYFRWGHVPSGGSFYESMRLRTIGSGSAELIVTGKIIKSGGTTSQFLKANGDVDSNSYYLASNPSAFIALTALSGTAPIQYNNTTGAISITQASGSTNGFLSSTDWTTFNNKQAALNGTGFVKISGTTISYDNSTYLTTAAAASTYVPYTGATSGVDIGTYTLSASNLIANGGFNAGALLLKQSSNAQTIFLGYTAITPVGNNTLNFGFSTGSGVWKNFTLSSFLLTDNINRTYTLPDASGTIALVGGSGVGTVTSVAALTLGTSGTDLSSSVANGTTTPVITLNVPTASAANRGALSAADWTTFNNKQNALTNPVTGTGTAGQVAYWSSGSAITGEANLFWDATNDRLGIGTATPAVKLNIVDTNPLVVGDSTGSLTVTYETGTTAIGQGGGIFLGIPASSGSFFSTYIKSAKEAADSANSAAALIFGTRVNGGSNTERMRITSGGNVQLTGDPFVYSNTTAGGTAIHAGLRFNSTNKSIRFFTNDVTAADIFSDGNVLIGSSGSNAGFKLDVNGTGRFSGALTGTSATFNSGGTSNAGFFQINDGTTTLGNSFATVHRNANDGNGRFSLSRWQVQNASGLDQSVYIGAQSVAGASNYSPNLIFGLSTGASSYTNYITIEGTGAATFSSSVKAPSFISDGGGSEGVMRIERDTVGTNAIIGALNFTNNNGATIYGRVRGGRNSAGDGYVSLGTGVGDNLYALEGGNVGIGTASPVYKLVVSNSGALGFEVDPTSGSGGVVSLLTYNRSAGAYKPLQINSEDIRLQTGLVSEERMRITSGGNVLIGTATNGASKLRISGLPTSAVGLSSGDVYNLAGVLMIA